MILDIMTHFLFGMILANTLSYMYFVCGNRIVAEISATNALTEAMVMLFLHSVLCMFFWQAVLIISIIQEVKNK